MSADKSELDSWSGKRGLIANIVLVAVWVYVAMIYLLAFDQQFHWGIFPP
jgi:preprotein translocase subunit SecE